MPKEETFKKKEIPEGRNIEKEKKKSLVKSGIVAQRIEHLEDRDRGITSLKPA